jgi:hypothetical protein
MILFSTSFIFTNGVFFPFHLRSFRLFQPFSKATPPSPAPNMRWRVLFSSGFSVGTPPFPQMRDGGGYGCFSLASTPSLTPNVRWRGYLCLHSPPSLQVQDGGGYCSFSLAGTSSLSPSVRWRGLSISRDQQCPSHPM